MDAQRLRNLTTRRLHTKMADVYQDIEYLTGLSGIMTHMIPNAMIAIELFLREKVTDDKFWNGKYDVNHSGYFKIEPMTKSETEDTLKKYNDLPNKLDNDFWLLR